MAATSQLQPTRRSSRRTKRPLPDAVRDTLATDNLISHILSYLHVIDLVRVRRVSKTFQKAVALPATWAHTVWQPAPRHKSKLTRILRHSLQYLHTLVLSHKIWMADDFGVQALSGVQDVQLVHSLEYHRNDPDLSNEELTDLLQSINEHEVRVTHIDVFHYDEGAVPSELLDELLAISTLKVVTLSVCWEVDGKQVSKYISRLAKKGCEIHLLQPNRSGHDNLMGEQAKLIQLAALQHAHHCYELYLSYVDVTVYQAYLDWLNGTASTQLPNSTHSQLKEFKLKIIDVERDEARELGLIDANAKGFDCNYNDWMHIFLSHHPNIESVAVNSEFYLSKMTDALFDQLRRMSHLKRLHIPSCNMSQQQRKVLQPLLTTQKLQLGEVRG